MRADAPPLKRWTARAWRWAPLTLLGLLTSTPHAREIPPWETIDVGGLTELRSRDGILSVTLHAAPHTVSIGGAAFAGATYNGQYAGPVLHVRPGDLVHIRLVNDLTDPTNLHFHGLRISPLNRGDNMHVVVLPGGTRDYLFRIAATHPPGLFWYHDHIHTLSEPHVMAGLSGTLLIDGFSRDLTGLAGVAQKLLVLKDYAAPGCQGAVLKTQLHCRVLSINGQAEFGCTMRPGETQLWRIANEGANLIIHLSVPGLRLQIIGRDGTPTAAPEDATTLDIMPASRMDVLVTAGDAGTFKLSALHVLTGAGEHFSANRDMGAVMVEGAKVPAPTPPPGFPAQLDLRTISIDAHRVVTFTENEAAGKYFIDGKLFDHNRIDARVKLGNVEEWTIRNQTQDFHEFHIHQMGFQVSEINGVTQPFTGYVDNAKVPEMGEIKVILPFTDPVILGSFMYHCHVLKHEDGGMMAQIEVYRYGAPAHPALCQFPQH